MRVLWHSEAPFQSTAYAILTRQIARLLVEAGHEVIVSAFNGLRGKELRMGPVRVLPGGMDATGNDLLLARYRRLEPDVVVCLHDIWALKPDVLREVPVAAWTPVDTTPVSAATTGALRACRWALTYSKFGERELRQAQFDPLYCPLGYDETIFTPQDRAACRAKLNVPDGWLFAVFVGTNLGNPSRKSVDRLVQAWATFAAAHPQARLYMHTNPLPTDGGLDLVAQAQAYGIPKDQLQFADAYKLQCGSYADETLALILNAADVCVAPSRGEGFGLVPVQAQACGTPVVVTGFSSQPELCFGGYTIPVDPVDNLEWTPFGAEQANLYPDQIVTGLEWAWEQRGNEALRAQAQDGARAYGLARVFERYLRPSLEYIADVNAQERGVFAAADPPETAIQEVAA